MKQFAKVVLALHCATLACSARTESDERTTTGSAGCLGLGCIPGEGTALPPCATDCLVGCTACHQAALKSSGLDLELPGRISRLKDVRATHEDLPSPTVANDCGTDDLLIDSHDVEASWLLKKIRGQQGRCGAAMPPSGALDEAKRACIAQFVTCVADLDPE